MLVLPCFLTSLSLSLLFRLRFFSSPPHPPSLAVPPAVKPLQFSLAVASLPGRADVHVCTCSAVAHGTPLSAYPAIASVCSFVCMSHYILSPQYAISLYTSVFIKELSKSWHFWLVPVFKPLLIMDMFILCPLDKRLISSSSGRNVEKSTLEDS